MSRIWYVDDDEASFALNERDLRREFPDAEFRVFPTCEAALAAAEEARPDVVVLDEHFAASRMQGRELLPLLRARWRRVAIIMITANPTVDLAVSTMRMGATDFLLKPFLSRDLLDCIHRSLAARRIDRRAEALEEDPLPAEAVFDGLVGSTALMRDLIRRADTVALTDATVLITGETGTGKGILAKYIHERSKRSGGAFVNANLAAASGELVESLLFGHERGAFTGAYERRRGKFELAAGGTIFLDEIGELAPAAQMKLLRVLQDGAFEPMGSAKTLQSDARVIAATNQDLSRLIESGSFREDLFYRLNVCHLTVPPLRRRMEDLDALVAYLIERYNREYGRVVRRVHPDLMQRWRERRWPGNLRELAATVSEAVIHAKGEEIGVEGCWPAAAPEDDHLELSLHALTEHLPLGDAMQRLRRARIFPSLDAWRKSNGDWNIHRAAGRLGISITALQDFLVAEIVAGPLGGAEVVDVASTAAAVADAYGISEGQATSLLRHGIARGKFKESDA